MPPANRRILVGGDKHRYVIASPGPKSKLIYPQDGLNHDGHAAWSNHRRDSLGHESRLSPSAVEPTEHHRVADRSVHGQSGLGPFAYDAALILLRPQAKPLGIIDGSVTFMECTRSA